MRRMLVLVLAILFLAACSRQAPEVTAQEQVPADQRTEAAASAGATDGGGGGGEATWVAVDISFESAPESIPAGPQTITLVNNGQAVHNVTIDGETIVEAQGGETQEGEVDLEPGTHEYICSVPGHDSSMNGELTVE